MSDINKAVIKAKNNLDELDILIKKNEKFILSSASRAIGRYVTKSDDQWSVALLAYNEAVNTYSIDKGSFYSFANLVIKRRLIDYIKSEAKHFNETSINPSAFDSDPDQEDEQLSINREVLYHLITDKDDSAKLEIEAIASELKIYGFTFYDLISASPKAIKTKTACAKAICFLIKDTSLLKQMRSTKTLPIKIIENN